MAAELAAPQHHCSQLSEPHTRSHLHFSEKTAWLNIPLQQEIDLLHVGLYGLSEILFRLRSSAKIRPFIPCRRSRAQLGPAFCADSKRDIVKYRVTMTFYPLYDLMTDAIPLEERICGLSCRYNEHLFCIFCGAEIHPCNLQTNNYSILFA